MSQLLVIYHKNCDDGFGAAWAIHQAEIRGRLKTFWPGGAEYVGGVYGFPPPDCHGRDIVLVDFCYPAAVMEELIAVAKSVFVLDHHKSAWEDMLSLAERLDFNVQENKNHDGGRLTQIFDDRLGQDLESTKVLMNFDMTRSGAAMAWDHYHSNAHWPTLIKYIQDRDLWVKKLPNVDAFTMALRSYPMTFETWDSIHDMFTMGYGSAGFNKFIQEGQSILRYQKQLVDQAVKASFWVTIKPPQGEPLRIRGANTPPALSSEVGEVLSEKFGGAGLTWVEGRDHFIYSLRSRGDNALDVSVVAKAFGGGGHAKASGFKSPTAVHEKEPRA